MGLEALSRSGKRSSGDLFRAPLHLARRARSQRSASHQRIAPAAQGGNVDIDPVVPPINGLRIESENFALFWSERRGKQARVFTFENVLVVQNERFVKFDELFRSIQVA